MRIKKIGRFWIKKCYKCKKKYKFKSIFDASKKFGFLYSRIDGFSPICRLCRKKYCSRTKKQQNARWRKYYQSTFNKLKVYVRTATKRKYGPAKNQFCKCGNVAAEWHHLKYWVDEAIPICKLCHAKEHSKKQSVKRKRLNSAKNS